MDLNEIMPKAGIEVDFDGGNFGVSIQGRDADEIIFIYQGNKEMYLTRKYERYEQFNSSDCRD